MSLSTNLVSGLVSGFDWRTMIDQLIEIEHRRVDLVEDRKSEYEEKLSEWQSVNTMLLSLKTASEALGTESAFKVYTSSLSSNTSTAASDVLSITTSTTASIGTYDIRVTQIAAAQKLSTQGYSDNSTALGLEGDFLVNGKAVYIATTDSLADIKDKINALNTGSNASNVTATILTVSDSDYRLVLTSDVTGSDGISLLDASSSNILQGLGIMSSSTVLKNDTGSGGAKTDSFTSTTTAIGDLYDFNTDPSGTSIVIGDKTYSINLASDSLNSIKAKIDADLPTGVTTSIVTTTVDGETRYQLQLDGVDASDFTDENNVLESIGILKGVVENVATEVHTADKTNTIDGSTAIQSTTTWDSIHMANVTNGDTITITGIDHNGNPVSGSYTINIATDDVDDLLTAIEDTFGDGVTATIESGKIKITDTTSGDSQLSVVLTENNQGGGALDFGVFSATTEGSDREITAGQDAALVVDGETMTRSSNSITDIIEGVTLNLTKAQNDTTITLTIDRDLDTIKSKINDLVDAYNAILDYINTQFSYDEETEETGGVLFGDGTLSSVKSDLINTVTKTITGLSSDFNRLSLIGITLDLTNTEEGKYEDLNISIDDDELTDALETNFNDVKKLFIAFGSSANSHIEYISHTDDTQGGAYDIDITQAATRTTLTGGSAWTPTNEDVTITDYATGRVATISLTTDMDIDGVVNAINSEFAAQYTEKLVGDNDTGYTSSTLFSDIDSNSDDKVINFWGTKRSGVSVSGSYTVDTTETLGTLLSGIEDMFDDEVTATIEGGKLVITDQQAGDSQLMFTIDTSEVANLDFGTVDVTPGAGDGSQEGRYAIPITASKTAGNELLLTHNNYGTGYIITAEETGAGLDLANATQEYGKDVAGSINGVTAAGSGQTLILDSDGNNADGLSINYTGTGTTTTTFTLTLGIAELLDRQLGFITDTTDGYVTYKQDSLQNSIDSFETQVEQMEAQLNRKMEMMINKFVAMEVALSKIQNQSDWLTGQINASYSGWAGW